MRSQRDTDQTAVRILGSAMTGMVALALLFFMAPFAGLGLLVAAFVGIPAWLWVRARRGPVRRAPARRTAARISR